MSARLIAARRVLRLLLPIKGELHAQWIDIRNRIDGYCCAKDLTGYGHWRCGLKARHDGPHRAINYTWNPGEYAQYSPLDYPNATVPRLTFSKTYIQRLVTMSWSNAWDKALIGARR
ncbi:hypothetical protein CH274_15460 [Rhodococcus sp. 06-418-5]|uniref:hypothetical protein n=1 Tax=Rhodococcus sp. 06-418-5 TaxID=2022507 RepID=UPI000B9ACA78|nr:hypothetical protein [Rhodococcus sp. 06-418-5]OZC80566.1 hypothetical protein CH274_15460 [Rhodococcus sp. 06-418-5]